MRKQTKIFITICAACTLLIVYKLGEVHGYKKAWAVQDKLLSDLYSGRMK